MESVWLAGHLPGPLNLCSTWYSALHCSAVVEQSSKFCELTKVDVNIALYAISEKSCSLHALQMGPDSDADSENGQANHP